MAQKWY